MLRAQMHASYTPAIPCITNIHAPYFTLTLRAARSSSLLFGTLPAAVNVTTTGSLLSLLDVIVQVAEEPSSSGLLNRGYEKLELSSNDGAGGDAVFIWILASRSNSSAGISAAITGVSIAVSDAERAAAAAAGYIQLSGNLNSGTGGSLVTLHIIRGSGRVAAGSLNSLEAAFTSSVLLGWSSRVSSLQIRHLLLGISIME